MASALTVLTAVSAMLAIYGWYLGPKRLFYFAKPLTTAILLTLALTGDGTAGNLYRALVAAGLLFALAGDVFLMLPEDRFIQGVASFMVTHVFYIAAFACVDGFKWGPEPLVPLLVCGAALYMTLYRRLGNMKLPVLAYCAVILAMVWQAVNGWIEGSWPGAGMAALGAVLFMISDSVLALDKFRAPHRAAQLVVLSSYYAAQWFIAVSV